MSIMQEHFPSIYKTMNSPSSVHLKKKILRKMSSKKIKNTKKMKIGKQKDCTKVRTKKKCIHIYREIVRQTCKTLISIAHSIPIWYFDRFL